MNDCVITEIKQQQKALSSAEMKQIIARYSEGASVYTLAREFDCHRSTISRQLKKKGINVSNKVTDRPALVEKVLTMYAEGMHAKEIGAKIGITQKSVLNILHENSIHIRHSTEYLRK